MSSAARPGRLHDLDRRRSADHGPRVLLALEELALRHVRPRPRGVLREQAEHVRIAAGERMPPDGGARIEERRAIGDACRNGIPVLVRDRQVATRAADPTRARGEDRVLPFEEGDLLGHLGPRGFSTLVERAGDHRVARRAEAAVQDVRGVRRREVHVVLHRHRERVLVRAVDDTRCADLVIAGEARRLPEPVWPDLVAHGATHAFAGEVRDVGRVRRDVLEMDVRAGACERDRRRGGMAARARGLDRVLRPGVVVDLVAERGEPVGITPGKTHHGAAPEGVRRRHPSRPRHAARARPWSPCGKMRIDRRSKRSPLSTVAGGGSGPALPARSSRHHCRRCRSRRRRPRRRGCRLEPGPLPQPARANEETPRRSPMISWRKRIQVRCARTRPAMEPPERAPGGAQKDACACTITKGSQARSSCLFARPTLAAIFRSCSAA